LSEKNTHIFTFWSGFWFFKKSINRGEITGLSLGLTKDLIAKDPVVLVLSWLEELAKSFKVNDKKNKATKKIRVLFISSSNLSVSYINPLGLIYFSKTSPEGESASGGKALSYLPIT